MKQKDDQIKGFQSTPNFSNFFSSVEYILAILSALQFFFFLTFCYTRYFSVALKPLMKREYRLESFGEHLQFLCPNLIFPSSSLLQHLHNNFPLASRLLRLLLISCFLMFSKIAQQHLSLEDSKLQFGGGHIKNAISCQYLV